MNDGDGRKTPKYVLANKASNSHTCVYLLKITRQDLVFIRLLLLANEMSQLWLKAIQST